MECRIDRNFIVFVINCLIFGFACTQVPHASGKGAGWKRRVFFWLRLLSAWGGSARWRFPWYFFGWYSTNARLSHSDVCFNRPSLGRVCLNPRICTARSKKTGAYHQPLDKSKIDSLILTQQENFQYCQYVWHFAVCVIRLRMLARTLVTDEQSFTFNCWPSFKHINIFSSLFLFFAAQARSSSKAANGQVELFLLHAHSRVRPPDERTSGSRHPTWVQIDLQGLFAAMQSTAGAAVSFYF